MKQSKSLKPDSYTQTIKLLLILFIIESYAPGIVAQGLNIYNNQPAAFNKTITLLSSPQKNKKRFWRATGQWTMMQVLPWASNRFIRNADFAKISPKSILHNLGLKNQEWDDNLFFNNQFSHPYQGSLYFNSFRSNGYNFWESVPAVFAGSLCWEIICETSTPAPNDIINTSIGGIVFGEMSTRLSKIILKKKKDNLKGIIRNAASFISNPLYQVNNLLDNKTKNENDLFNNSEPFAGFTTDAGVRLIGKKGKFNRGASEIFTRIQLQYGDPFDGCKTPFSNFSVETELGNSDTTKANTLHIEGTMFGKKLKHTDKLQQVFNISINYDFLQNAAFVYGAQSFRANLLSKVMLTKKIQLQVKASAGLIALAAVHNPYMYYGEGRNYDYSSGGSIHLGAGINIANKIFYTINCSGSRMITLNGYKSSHLFYHAESTLRVVIYKNLSMSMAAGNYYFKSSYKEYPNVHDKHLLRHFAIGYKVGL